VLGDVIGRGPERPQTGILRSQPGRPRDLLAARQLQELIPRWLDRTLPNITIEPPHDAEAPRGAASPRPAEA
jgi:hypothetical protein